MLKNRIFEDHLFNRALAQLTLSRQVNPIISIAVSRWKKGHFDVAAQAFVLQKEEIITAYAKKDEKGKPIVVNNQVDFGENDKVAEKLYKDLIEQDALPFPQIVIPFDKLPPGLLSGEEIISLEGVFRLKNLPEEGTEPSLIV